MDLRDKAVLITGASEKIVSAAINEPEEQYTVHGLGDCL